MPLSETESSFYICRVYKIPAFRYNKNEPDRKAVEKMENKTLGAFIAQLRKEKAMTQKQLAELLNVSDKTVSHWECDETSPDISLLPTLANTLGVTVDELLQGEKKIAQPAQEPYYISPKGEGFATRTINKIKSKMAGDITERYRYFRMLCLAGTIIPCVVILIEAFVNLMAGGYFLNELAFIPGIVTFIGSLWILAISLGLTLGARLAFYKSTLPSADASEEEKKYIFKANSVCFNNLFLAFSTLPMALTGFQDILDFAVILNIGIAVIFLTALWLVLILILNKKGFLRTEKKKMLTLKYVSVFVVSALVVSSPLLVFMQSYYPSVQAIYFDTSAEFIAYMETPKAKPADAYMIDGVTASTRPPTMPAPGQTSPSDSPVQSPPTEDAAEEIGETVLGYCGNEWVSFRWLNQEVSDLDYLENDGSFRVVTYEAKIKQKDMRILIDDGVPIVIFAFTVVDALTCLFLYKKKINALTGM